MPNLVSFRFSIEELVDLQRDLGVTNRHLVQIDTSGHTIAHTHDERLSGASLEKCSLYQSLCVWGGVIVEEGLYLTDINDPVDIDKWEKLSGEMLNVAIVKSIRSTFDGKKILIKPIRGSHQYEIFIEGHRKSLLEPFSSSQKAHDFAFIYLASGSVDEYNSVGKIVGDTAAEADRKKDLLSLLLAEANRFSANEFLQDTIKDEDDQLEARDVRLNNLVKLFDAAKEFVNAYS